LKKKQAGASSEELAEFLSGHSQYHSQHLGQANEAELCCGQVAGVIDDVPTAAAVVDDIVDSIGRRLDELKARMEAFL
jgi:hypothetical protein